MIYEFRARKRNEKLRYERSVALKYVGVYVLIEEYKCSTRATKDLLIIIRFDRQLGAMFY